jgi:membrane protein YqaA with SNARE-associated domain
VRNVRAGRHAVLVHLTADTWAVVAATLAAAFLGAIVAYIGSARQQRKQAERDVQARREQAAYNARIRLEAALAELLAVAQDVLIGVRAFREAHERRTMPR